MLYSVFKHIVFKLDPEWVHDVIINSSSSLMPLSKFMHAPKVDDQYQLSSNGLTWSFPIGLAAGFDKNAQAIEFFDSLGFGAIEVGTVTKLPQSGNPRPRISRHPHINSIQNSMGFPNAGADEIAKNLRKTHTNNICLGVNLGKNKNTSEQNTPEEYAELYRRFAPLADYIAINISSPNTPGLRQFQDRAKLLPLLAALNQARLEFARPCFIKISPDMNEADIKLICELSKEKKFSGVIATNTTIQHNKGNGGLSGQFVKPMAQKTRAIVCNVLKEDPDQTIIGVGGIDSYQEIQEFWKLGGTFVQIYTSFIYHGPQLLKNFAEQMQQDMQRRSCQNIQELVTSYQRN